MLSFPALDDSKGETSTTEPTRATQVVADDLANRFGCQGIRNALRPMIYSVQADLDFLFLRWHSMGVLHKNCRRGVSIAMLRCAALSMLQDTKSLAKYGWTHALTIPQAIHGISNDLAGLYLAASVAVSYRGFGTQPLQGVNDKQLAEELYEIQVVKLRKRFPQHEFDTIATSKASLALLASSLRDAHLVKFTLACFDMCNIDPDFEALYLAAAGRLLRIWTE